MNITKLNKYIKHYLEEDKTKSAIMLNAPWGTGKSYYIQNELIPYLKKDEKNRCIVISLYGIKELSDLSKNLYFELKLQSIKKKEPSKKKKKHNNEIIATTIGLGKTIIKGVTSFAGIDLSIDSSNWEKLYASVDLSEKLIVFEDIERSNIDILEFMGYVNTLVEQDGVKVMLVANETEVLKFESSDVQENDQKESIDTYDSFENQLKIYTDKTKEYLKTKEKTVSDTIQFEGNYYIAIQNIITSFNNKMLNEFADTNSITELVEMLDKGNLRSFIFACQKTIDIYNYLPKNLDKDFMKAIFYGNIIFSQKIKAGKRIDWDGNLMLSLTLGDSKYPLFRFCYNYIMEQLCEFDNITVYEKAFQDLKLYDKDKSSGDPDLQIIYTSHIQTEKDVRKAINNIENRLADVTDISFYEYGRIANVLVEISSFLDCDITKHKALLVKNLFGRGDKIDGYLLFNMLTHIHSEEKKAEFLSLKNDIIESLKGEKGEYLGFKYNVDSVEDFCDRAYKNYGRIISSEGFLSNLDIDQFTDLLLKCSSKKIQELRLTFIRIYETSNIKEHLHTDKPYIDRLLNNVKQIRDNEVFDKIQKLQLTYFVDNLEEISRKLS